jgi:Tat protein secretion system quality control protein TatD with DNase activity
MGIRFYDAHNHLQDARLAPHREAIFAALQREGVAGMVVNGSCEEDWPEVLALARLCHHPVAADVSRRILFAAQTAPTDVGG